MHGVYSNDGAHIDVEVTKYRSSVVRHSAMNKQQTNRRPFFIESACNSLPVTLARIAHASNWIIAEQKSENAKNVIVHTLPHCGVVVQKALKRPASIEALFGTVGPALKLAKRACQISSMPN
jgi:hypothetical protein